MPRCATSSREAGGYIAEAAGFTFEGPHARPWASLSPLAHPPEARKPRDITPSAGITPGFVQPRTGR